MPKGRAIAGRKGTAHSAQGDAPKDLSAGKVISLIAEAFGQKEADIVKDIARMAATPDGRESDPTRETILSYIKEPTKRKKVTRRNRLTPTHHKFAHLAVNYLDGRRPDPSKVSREGVDESAWREARKLCKFVLREERDKRYERVLGTDFGKRAAMDRLDGVFAVCRRDTADRKYHQELLILQNSGKEKAPRYFCTYITAQSVARGEWYIIGSIIFCNMSGWREDNSHELGALYFGYDDRDRDLLTGFLAGAGTEEKIPVAMPMVAVRVPEATRSIREIGDLGDEAILREFRKIKVDMAPIQDRLGGILERQIVPVIFGARDYSKELRNAFDNGQALVHERFREFCQGSVG
jgi:hypothetical protein